MSLTRSRIGPPLIGAGRRRGRDRRGRRASAVWTAPVRESVRAYTELLGAANRQDVAAARRLCSTRYLRTHPLRPAADGGTRRPSPEHPQELPGLARGPERLALPDEPRRPRLPVRPRVGRLAVRRPDRHPPGPRPGRPVRGPRLDDSRESPEPRLRLHRGTARFIVRDRAASIDRTWVRRIESFIAPARPGARFAHDREAGWTRVSRGRSAAPRRNP